MNNTASSEAGRAGELARSTTAELEALSDAELAVRARGSRSAFGVLVQRHTAALRRYALRLGAGSDADDIVQEALLKAWRQIGSFDAQRATLSTWLHRIVHNQTVDAWRRRPPVDPQADTFAIDEAVDPNASSERDTQRREVQRALAALPERQRAALVLRQMQGFSQREAAHILEISEDALESLVARARRTLRARLQEDNNS